MGRSGAPGFLTVGMGAGAAALIVVGVVTGRIAVLSSFGAPQWIAGLYPGIGGGALAFILGLRTGTTVPPATESQNSTAAYGSLPYSTLIPTKVGRPAGPHPVLLTVTTTGRLAV